MCLLCGYYGFELGSLCLHSKCSYSLRQVFEDSLGKTARPGILQRRQLPLACCVYTRLLSVGWQAPKNHSSTHTPTAWGQHGQTHRSIQKAKSGGLGARLGQRGPGGRIREAVGSLSKQVTHKSMMLPYSSRAVLVWRFLQISTSYQKPRFLG